MEHWKYQLDYLEDGQFVTRGLRENLTPEDASELFIAHLHAMGREPLAKELTNHIAFGVDADNVTYRVWAGSQDEHPPEVSAGEIRSAITADEIIMQLLNGIAEGAGWFSDGDPVVISEVTMNGFRMQVDHGEELGKTTVNVTREQLVAAGCSAALRSGVMFEAGGSWALRKLQPRREQPPTDFDVNVELK